MKQCPICDSNSGLEVITKEEEFKIKAEIIKVEINLYHCNVCGESFSSDDFDDPFKLAYREYRKRKGMVQPEEIVTFRQKYDLTQKELSDLLGFGGVTLSRYENGSLQDVTHDRILRLVMDPTNLLHLLDTKSSIILDKKKKALRSRLLEELSIAQLCFELLTPDKPSEFNGFKEMRLDKIAEVIKMLCYNRDVYKTKLLKLLFYADFLHFKEVEQSITGLKYARLPMGPVPHEYNLVLETIVRSDPSIHMEPVEFEKYSGELVKVDSPPNTGNFTDTELKILKTVNKKFSYYSSKDISLETHTESAYKETKHANLISYRYAKEINLD